MEIVSGGGSDSLLAACIQGAYSRTQKKLKRKFKQGPFTMRILELELDIPTCNQDMIAVSFITNSLTRNMSNCKEWKQ